MHFHWLCATSLNIIDQSSEVLLEANDLGITKTSALDSTICRKKMEYYASFIFTHGDIQITNSEDPCPSWPFQSLEESINLTDKLASPLNLDVGQFLCVAQTAINFEAYGLEVSSNKAWYDIFTCWVSHFTGKLHKVKTIRALYNRRIKRFKELQKNYNRRGDQKVKELLNTFLSASVFTKQTVEATSTTTVENGDCGCANYISQTQTVIPSTTPVKHKGGVEIKCVTPQVNIPVVKTITPRTPVTAQTTVKTTPTSVNREPVVPKLVRKVSALRLGNKRQQKKFEEVTSKNTNLETKNTNLEEKLNVQTGELKKLRNVINVDLDTKNEKLKERNLNLWKKTKQMKELKMKTVSQKKKIEQLQSEISRLAQLATENIAAKENVEQHDEKLNIKNLANLKRRLKNIRKKMKRREQNVNILNQRLEQFKTDKDSQERYYQGIVEQLKDQHNFTVEMQKNELEALRQIETQKNGKYKAEVRLMYYDLLCKGVSANIIQSVVKTVLIHATEYDLAHLTLPSRSTAQRMVSEAGELANIRAAYEIAKEDKALSHMSDGTTKHLIHWGSHVVKLQSSEDQNVKTFTLTVSPVSSGKADDAIQQLQEQFDNMSTLADDLDMPHSEDTYSVSRINARMSDRAANEIKTSRLLKEKREAAFSEKVKAGLISEADVSEHGSFFPFTCAAHKINNMAVAMSTRSVAYLYADATTQSTGRAMHGAKKHIYECNKLLCENARKEYGLGNEFRAYSLCNEQDSGSQLFKPIVGNRYLIFLQNAIPTLASRESVLLFLEDVKDAKENPGLNRLEFSVQAGYIDSKVQVEEAAFAMMYFHVCSPLLQQAKTVKSPLDMNFYYQCAVSKLDQWSKDPSALIAGTGTMWEGAKGPSVYDGYMDRIHAKFSNDELLVPLLKEMARAGKEKLQSHAVEHLPGGIYAEPSAAAIDAANTIGDATNDVIESTFGMLDRQMMIAPSSNPLNVGSLIAAKRDKPVDWVLNNNIAKNKVCDVAMKNAKRKREAFGTRDEQTKRRYLSIQPERQASIAKRRLNRIKREQRLRNNLEKAKTDLFKNVKKIKVLPKSKVLEQYTLWKSLCTTGTVKCSEVLKCFLKKSLVDQRDALKQLVIANDRNTIATSTVHVHISTTMSCNDDEEWNSSDEETIDMLRPLVSFTKNCGWSSDDDEPLCDIVPL